MLCIGLGLEVDVCIQDDCRGGGRGREKRGGVLMASMHDSAKGPV